MVLGIVKDEKGDPVIGASVRIKGQNLGTITNTDGQFSLDVNSNDVLEISYVGYNSQNVQIDNKKRVNVILRESSKILDEVLVVGYGTMKKSDLTGSVASVKGEEVTKVSSGSIDKLLQGRVSGLTVINNSDDNPRGGATIRVRGVSSINGSNSPLVVVDGVPMGDAGGLNSLNPNIIESVELLKDASSTAIYGSRGANGVLMVTTKNGLDSKPTVFVNSKVGVSFFSKGLDYWKDPLLMAQLSNESYENAGIEPLYVGKKDTYGTYYPSIAEIRDGIWPYHTIWKDYIFRTALTQDYNIGVQGSGNNGRYYINLGYYKGEGMQKKDDYDKITFDVSYSNQLTKSLMVSTKAGFVKGNSNYNYGMDYNRNPLWPVYNGDGSYFKANSLDYGNPVMMTRERKNVAENMEGYAILKFDWNIIKGLKLAASGNARGGNSNSSYYNPPTYTYEGDLYNGIGGYSNSNFRNLTCDAYLTYNKLIAEKHQLSFMAGTSLERSLSKGSSLEGRGFQNQILKDENLGGAKTKYMSTSQSKSVLLSYFSRINYTFNDRYLCTFTMRADGCSKFGKDRKWGYFPSGAIAWRMSEEKFIKDLNLFDQLKLRASYGLSGNQGISPYQTCEKFGSDYYNNNGTEQIVYGIGEQIGREGIGGRYVTWGGMANADLGWEKTSQFDIGLDASLLDNRVSVTFDYYFKRTTDLLRQKYLPPSSAYDLVWVNDGTIDNKGIELSITGHIIDKGDWNLNSTLLINANRNKVVRFGSKEDSGYIETNGIKYLPYGSNNILGNAYMNVLALGHPVNSFFGYKVNGIIQKTINSSSPMLQAGEFNYVGLNSDGTLDPNQRTIIGNPNPKFNGSLSINLSHKIGFDLSVLLCGSYGGDIFSNRKLGSAKLQVKRWTPDDPTNSRPSLRSDRQYFPSNWFVEDGSFLRVQNITLGYTLPERYAKEFANARMYISVSNPVTFSHVSEYDPEVGENGVGDVAYPRICTITTGIEIKF
jgi:TonB-linked SusC/RagA family outer membrane protein